MTDETQAILEQALKLPANERAEVAEQLIVRLDETPDTDAEKAWQEEIQKRLQQLDSGQAAAIPWEVVQRRLGHGD
jgi:putative addiction module component (TIGR02574 family)